MTVAELIEELKELPPDANIVIRHRRDDDIPDDYDCIDCYYDDGEAFLDIDRGEDDE